MPRPVVKFHPLAIKETETALQWYAVRSLPAARAFVIELDHAIEMIRQEPGRWPRWHHSVRRYIMPRFPFSLIYRVNNNVIESLHLPIINASRAIGSHAKNRLLIIRN